MLYAAQAPLDPPAALEQACPDAHPVLCTPLATCRFDPVRNAEAFPQVKAIINGRREKVGGAVHRKKGGDLSLGCM